MYALFSGHLPFDHPEDEEVIPLILESPVDFSHSLWKVYPQPQQLVSQLLNRDIHSRPSALQALSHPWFSQSSLSSPTLS